MNETRPQLETRHRQERIAKKIEPGAPFYRSFDDGYELGKRHGRELAELEEQPLFVLGIPAYLDTRLPADHISIMWEPVGELPPKINTLRLK